MFTENLVCAVLGHSVLGTANTALNKRVLIQIGETLVYWLLIIITGFPNGSVGKESACNAGATGSIPRWEDPLEGEMATPEKSYGQKSLAGYCPKGCKELDTTERLSTQL